MPNNLDPLTTAEIIATLDLQPHPEGGHYLETFRDPIEVDGRSVATAIYYLLAEGERSAWHRVDASEIWHWYAGAPLALTISLDGEETQIQHLGPALISGQRPQGIVPAQAWQTAASLGRWTLVGCMVAPGFDFSGFEMAPPGWHPGK